MFPAKRERDLVLPKHQALTLVCSLADSPLPALPLVGIAMLVTPSSFAMETPSARPRALNEPVGRRPCGKWNRNLRTMREKYEKMRHVRVRWERVEAERVASEARRAAREKLG